LKEIHWLVRKVLTYHIVESGVKHHNPTLLLLSFGKEPSNHTFLEPEEQ